MAKGLTNGNKAMFQTWRNKPGTATNQDGENEGVLISKVIAFLMKNGVYCWRQQNAGAFDATTFKTKAVLYTTNAIEAKEQSIKKGKIEPTNKELLKKDFGNMVGSSFKKVPDGIRGVPDICGIEVQTGKGFYVEVKINDDKLSEHQISFRNKIIDAGGTYLIAKTYEQFKESYYKRFERKEQTSIKNREMALFHQ